MANTKPGAMLYPRMETNGPFSMETPGAVKKDGETMPRRNIRCKDGLITTPAPEIKTLYDIVNYSANKFGNAQCIGSRKLINTHTETKKVKKMVDGKEQEQDKKWTYFEFSGYTFKSFVEFQKSISTIGSGQKALGLSKGEKIHLYGATSMNWFSMAHAAFTQSLTIVTAYDTLGEEGLRSSINQVQSKAIFLDAGLLSTFSKIIKDIPSIQTIIYNNETKPKQDVLDNLSKDFSHIKVVSFDEMVKLGEKSPAEHVAPEPEDLACVMFTSGSTGTPKGVKIKHKSVVAAIAGVTAIVGDLIHPGDALLAYLPQAHILEFIFESASIVWGSVMGYGSPRTLTDTSVRNCKGDIAEFKPTIMVGVPAVWETVRKGIVAKVNQGSSIQQKLFWGAMTAKKMLLANGLPGTAVLDSVVFSKVRAATGGRLRICMSGGGPVAKETQEFISMAIAPLISGYGLTETCAMGALNDPRAWTSEAHGDIPASIDVKLVDFKDAGYFSTNDPPQGELWIRGPPVTEGYYDNEEETKNALTEDGWFMTGDIAQFEPNGHIKIIDRKKNLVKTQNGEYIALEKLESVYRASPLVANICVYAAEDQAKPIAIIVPAEPALVKLANENGIKGHGLEDLVENEKVNDLVLKDLQKAGRAGNLAGIEIVDGVVLDKDEWTPQNGFVTAAQKIQRKKILEKNKQGVDRAYKK